MSERRVSKRSKWNCALFLLRIMCRDIILSWLGWSLSSIVKLELLWSTISVDQPVRESGICRGGDTKMVPWLLVWLVHIIECKAFSENTTMSKITVCLPDTCSQCANTSTCSANISWMTILLKMTSKSLQTSIGKRFDHSVTLQVGSYHWAQSPP